MDADSVIVDDEPSSGEVFGLDTVFARVAGALVGGAIGDAMGWPTEFMKTSDQVKKTFGRDRLSEFVPWEKRTGGRFNTYIDYIQPGDYSDDTQLTLCVARSLLPDGRCDLTRFAKAELPAWLHYARGAGATITAAARAADRRSASWNDNFFGYEGRRGRTNYLQAGANGAAMRIAPIALANHDDLQQCFAEVRRNTIVTHGHPRALVGAITLASAIAAVIDTRSLNSDEFHRRLTSAVGDIATDPGDPDLEAWLRKWDSLSVMPYHDVMAETRDEMIAMLQLAFQIRESRPREILERLGCFRPQTKGSGTSTVAAAIALFYRFGGNYAQLITESVNMIGSDTDTIASMAGTLAGAYLGLGGIPDQWVAQLQDRDYFMRVSEAVTRIAFREARENDLNIDFKRQSLNGTHDVVELAKKRRLTHGQRVTHPIFGFGHVYSVHSQEIRRRNGGTMLLARVEFDTGQSCVFRSYSSPVADEA